MMCNPAGVGADVAVKATGCEPSGFLPAAFYVKNQV